jgi:RNA-directed DNA polymerase
MIITLNGTKRLKDIDWDEISWKHVNRKVSLLQERIFKASKNGNISNAKYLQSVLVKLPEAKLIAVRRVTTENKGRTTGGVDKQIITTASEKLKLTRQLTIDGKANPIRRVWIPKAGKATPRPLGIPTIRDRAKQMLVKMALEPAWEAKFEPNSYGFRPGRNCHDAIEAVFNNVRTMQKHKWILDADLKGCYDNIDHAYLLRCLKDSPAYVVTQIKAWLEAGIFEGYLPYLEDYETIPVNQKGTPPFARSATFASSAKAKEAREGGIISPLLANIALHGLETHLRTWNSKLPEPDGSDKRAREKYRALSVIRYADDFVVIHYSQQRINEAKEELQRWLKSTSKLELEPSKTSIKHIQQGFDFLGFRIISIKKNDKPRTKIYPQKRAVKRIIDKAHGIIFSNKAARTEWLIRKLRPVILGWANYFRYRECSRTFNHIDNLLWGMLRKWVNRRSTSGGRLKAWNKYFPGTPTRFDGTEYANRFILKASSKVDEKIFLPKLSWVHHKKWIKIKLDASPYDRNRNYWTDRKASYAGLSATQSKLLIKQQFICPVCHGKISPWSHIEVDHKESRRRGGKDKLNNLQVLHKICHIRKTKVEVKQVEVNKY